MHTRSHTYGVFLVVGILGAFVTAFIFILVIQLTLPPDDLAYGQPIFTILSDPFVRAVATPVAFVSGLLASPLLFFCLRRLRLTLTLPIVFGSVLAAVVLTTPFSQRLGLFCAYAALAGSCFLCSRIRATDDEGTQERDYPT
jgi:hypothetical protein